MSKRKQIHAPFVKHFECVYCKAKFWWRIFPTAGGGEHKKDCPILAKGKNKKPLKFTNIKVSSENFPQKVKQNARML